MCLKCLSFKRGVCRHLAADLKRYKWWKERERSHLTDESTELTGSETVVDAGEDGNGDDDVAEDSSEVIKGVNADWERRG